MIGRGCSLAAFLSACALWSCAGNSPAQEQEVDQEYVIKAAYLYRFPEYVQWPKNAVPEGDEEFVIGVLGKDPFGVHLDRLAREKKIEGKKIVVRRFKSAADCKPCHILFVASEADTGSKEQSAEDRLAALLKKAKDCHALIVSDREGMALKGSTVNFVIEDNHVKFEINMEAAKKAGLKIKAPLLKIAKTVIKE